MKLVVRFKNLKPSPFLKKVANEETEKLSKYFDGRFSIDCTIFKKDNKNVTMLKVTGPHFIYHSKSHHDSLPKSLIEAFEKVSRQVDKKKDKMRNKIRKENLQSPRHSQVFQLIKEEEQVLNEIMENAA